MISDEEIMQAAIEADIAWDDNGVIRTPYRADADIQPALTRFAHAIYNIGRQRQRDSDAALCESMHGARNGDCAVSVLCNNTGEP